MQCTSLKAVLSLLSTTGKMTMIGALTMQHLLLRQVFELGEDAIRKSKLKNRYQKMFNCKLEKAKEVETDDWELMRRKFISKMKDMKR